MLKNGLKFVVTFKNESDQKPTFIDQNYFSFYFFFSFCKNWPEKVGKWPLLKTKVAAKNAIGMRFFGVLAGCPLFFVTNGEKKKLKYIII